MALTAAQRAVLALLAVVAVAVAAPTRRVHVHKVGEVHGPSIAEPDDEFDCGRSHIASPYPDELSDPAFNVTPWTPGNLEIHMFQVGQGHSQLVIFPSGFTMLIDVMEKSWNTGLTAKFVADRVYSILGHRHINVGSMSHWHLDHMGYVGYGGFWYLIENELLTFDRIVDRDGGVWKDGAGNGTKDGVCEPTEIEWHNVGTVGGTAERWVCYATDPANTKIYPIRELAKLGSSQIVPPDAGAKVTVVAVDALGVYQKDGVTPVFGDHSTQEIPPSENDYCIGFLIELGNFRYITSGDMDGEYDESEFGYTYNDAETVMAQRVDGLVDLMLVNHHGSGHSSNLNLLQKVQPQASMIGCGYDNTHDHPAQGTLDRLASVDTKIFLNQVCALDRDYKGATFAEGDVVVVSKDGGNTFTVAGVPFTSRKARARK